MTSQTRIARVDIPGPKPRTENPSPKQDQGKVRYDLIPPGPLALIARCFMVGMKYDGPRDRNPGWTKVKGWRTVYTAALFRHLEEYRSGHWAAEDTKLPHLAHLATNAIILLALETRARLQKD